MATLALSISFYGHTRQLSGKESACQCRRYGFNPWVRKIPWRRAWQSTAVFMPREFHGQRSLASYSPWDHKDTTEWLTLSLFTFSNIKKKKLQEQYKLLDPLHTNYLNENILLYFSHLWRDIFLLTWCLSPLNTCMHPQNKDPSLKYNHHTNPSSQKFNTDMVQPDPQAQSNFSRCPNKASFPFPV